MSEVYLGRGARKRMLTLGKMLGEGAAGKVYAIDGMAGSAAKLYHDPAEAKRYEPKIEAMIAAPPDLPPAEHQGGRYPQISWPEAKLYDARGSFIGFLMPEIDFGRSTSLVNLLQKSSRRIEKLSDYYGYRVLVARNLASVFAELHRAGHHMIDMKPANLRFYPTVSWMAVVDTDGFSIQGKAGRIAADVLSDEYIAPESWKVPAKEQGEAQDLFALAVIIFQLLNNGVHPFAGSAGGSAQATDLQARILEGLYPYALRPKAGLSPSAASIHRMFRRNTRVLFDTAFQGRGPRPSAEEWRDHLDVLMGQMTPCAAKPEEHVHFGAGCGFCGHEARVAAAKARPAVKRTPPPRPAHRAPAAGSGPATVRYQGQAMAMSLRPARAMPFAMPMPVPRRRTRSSGWGGVMMLVLLLGMGLVTQDYWRPMLPGFDGVVQAADTAIPPLDVPVVSTTPDAEVASFAEPRDYLVLPTGGALTVALRNGPGDRFPAIQRLNLHDSVVGRGTRAGADGKNWIWVTRSSDGAAGFLAEDALLQRAQPGSLAAVAPKLGCNEGGACEEAPTLPNKGTIEARYGELFGQAQGYDRAYLADGQRLWETQRARCETDSDPTPCRKALDLRRMADLEGWRRAEAAGGSDGDAVRPTAGSISKLR